MPAVNYALSWLASLGCVMSRDLVFVVLVVCTLVVACWFERYDVARPCVMVGGKA
jgi:hypothetical protein